jgi:hypothetical protein
MRLQSFGDKILQLFFYSLLKRLTMDQPFAPHNLIYTP